MSITIGPNFGNELIAAGLAGAPISWSVGGSAAIDTSRLSPAQLATFNAVLAAHDHTKPDPRATAAALIAAGCAIVSTANPGTLSGTYPLDDASLGKITGVAARIALGKGLPLGAATVSVPDIRGALHAFGPTDLENLGDALSDYVAGIEAALASQLSGGATAFPAQPVTIA